MNQDREHKKIIKSLGDIAFGRSNDAVKLVFLNDDNAQEILNGLDLTMLSEVKRGQNGSVEIKLVNRLEALKMLLDELKPPTESGNNISGLITALNAAAGTSDMRSDISEY